MRHDVNVDVFAHSQQKVAGVFHSPCHVRDAEMGGRGCLIAVEPHLNLKLERVIGSVDVEGAFGRNGLRSPRFEGAGDLRGMKEGPWVFVRLEHFLMHFGVAVLVATLSARQVDQHFPLGNARRGIECHKTTLELKRAMSCVRVPTQRPVDFSGSRVEVDRDLWRLGGGRRWKEKRAKENQRIYVPVPEEK